MGMLMFRGASDRLTRGVLVGSLLGLSMFQNSAVAAPTLSSIQAMSAHLSSDGLVGFLSAASANAWEMPAVKSKWHLENVAVSPDQVYEGAARGLGLQLVSAVDASVPLLETEQGAAVLTRARGLVDLAEWVGGTNGYGNLLVASHGCDVALIGLGRLVADLEFPLDEARAQVERCSNLTIAQPSERAKLLNFEVGDSLFSESISTDSELEKVWSAHSARIALQRSGGSIPMEGLTDLVKQGLASMGLDPAGPEPNAPFFADERCSLNTTFDCWETKRHEPLVVGVPHRRNLDQLQKLITFRSVVGAYPNVPQFANPIVSAREQAFHEAWDNHETPATRNLGGGAADVLERIESGKFVDADTEERRFRSPSQ